MALYNHKFESESNKQGSSFTTVGAFLFTVELLSLLSAEVLFRHTFPL